MAQRSVPAPFLTKTYLIVDDPSTDDMISWNANGSGFVVWKTAEFSRDLLPNYFKHNNFSSFVRQLNTYGFRKVVSDKWEFANDNFRRGQIELLSGIHRRRAAPSQPKSAAGGHSSPSNSGEDIASTSTSTSPPATTQVADLTEENERLRKNNQILSSELAQTKKQCDELLSFLTDYLKVGPEKIERIMGQGSFGSADDGLSATVDLDDDGNKGGIAEEDGETLKLFGVPLRPTGKRNGDDELGLTGPRRKAMKSVDYHSPPLLTSSNICN